jgi:hypothetical protein
MFPTSAGPRYVLAMSVCSGTAFIAILSATLLRFLLARLNKKLDRGEWVEGAINSGPTTDLVVQEGAIPSKAAERGFRFLL